METKRYGRSWYRCAEGGDSSYLRRHVASTCELSAHISNVLDEGPITCTDSRSGISRFVPRWIRPKGHCRIYFRLPIASASDSAYILPEAMAICLSSLTVLE